MPASTWRSRSTARRSGPIPYRWIPEAARLLRPGGRLIFLVNATLLMLCVPDGETDGAGRPTGCCGRTSACTGSSGASDASVEFHLGHGDWIRLLRANGFEVEELVELRPGEGATELSRRRAEWARHWPSEEVWRARKRAGAADARRPVNDVLARSATVVRRLIHARSHPASLDHVDDPARPGIGHRPSPARRARGPSGCRLERRPPLAGVRALVRRHHRLFVGQPGGGRHERRRCRLERAALEVRGRRGVRRVQRRDPGSRGRLASNSC